MVASYVLWPCFLCFVFVASCVMYGTGHLLRKQALVKEDEAEIYGTIIITGVAILTLV